MTNPIFFFYYVKSTNSKGFSATKLSEWLLNYWPKGGSWLTSNTAIVKFSYPTIKKKTEQKQNKTKHTHTQ